ncbi:MAG: hypothetical protein LH629_05995 [Ignavibacteria bacterium]|nr:hypothetical protein [Ignavibacteria bacterium]
MTEDALKEANTNRQIYSAINNLIIHISERGSTDSLKFGYHREEIKEIIISALKSKQQLLKIEFDKL